MGQIPLFFVTSTCAGVAFAFLANTYLVHNDAVKSESERNSVHATLSLLTAFTPVNDNQIYRFFYHRVAPFFESRGSRFCSYGFLNGLGVGFFS